MNESAIRAGIYSLLQSVDDIGIVHDYDRWAADWDAFIRLFHSPAHNQIRGWEITRIRVPEHRRGNTNFRHHVYLIKGYMSLQDKAASEKTFQPLIEAVCEKFRSAPDGLSWYYMNGDKPEDSPVQVLAIEARLFGSVLCHYAEIQLSVTERIVS